MLIADQIHQKLRSLQPTHLKIDNESFKHAVPDNSETHFRVEVASEQFVGLSLVKRHQLIYQLLADELAGPVHALAIHAFTPDQWMGKAPASPDCQHQGSTA